MEIGGAGAGGSVGGAEGGGGGCGRTREGNNVRVTASVRGGMNRNEQRREDAAAHDDEWLRLAMAMSASMDEAPVPTMTTAGDYGWVAVGSDAAGPAVIATAVAAAAAIAVDEEHSAMTYPLACNPPADIASGAGCGTSAGMERRGDDIGSSARWSDVGVDKASAAEIRPRTATVMSPAPSLPLTGTTAAMSLVNTVGIVVRVAGLVAPPSHEVTRPPSSRSPSPPPMPMLHLQNQQQHQQQPHHCHHQQHDRQRGGGQQRADVAAAAAAAAADTTRPPSHLGRIQDDDASVDRQLQRRWHRLESALAQARTGADHRVASAAAAKASGRGAKASGRGVNAATAAAASVAAAASAATDTGTTTHIVDDLTPGSRRRARAPLWAAAGHGGKDAPLPLGGITARLIDAQR